MKNSRGTTAIEFALVLPVFAFLIFAIFDMGYYMFVQNTLQYATVEGARLAMVGGTLNGSNGSPLSRAASITQEIENVADLAGISSAALQISIFPITSTYSDPTGWNGEQNAGNPGDYMRVVTSYTYTFLTPFMGQFFPNGVSTITAQTTYRNELFSD